MSKNILHIESSLFGEDGVSSKLTTELVSALTDKLSATVVKRDVSSDPLPHLDGKTLQALGNGERVIGDDLIEELKAADVVVIGAPMYNFSVPSTLKAWFDHIARAGATFKYTASGPVGLLTGKKVYVVSSRGGLHEGKSTDTETPFLKVILNFVGLTDVEYVYVEGLAMTDHKDGALDKARAEIQQLVEEA